MNPGGPASINQLEEVVRLLRASSPEAQAEINDSLPGATMWSPTFAAVPAGYVDPNKPADSNTGFDEEDPMQRVYEQMRNITGPKAAFTAIGGMGVINNYLSKRNSIRDYRKNAAAIGNTDVAFDPTQNTMFADFGNQMPNLGLGPDQSVSKYTFAQDEGSNFQQRSGIGRTFEGGGETNTSKIPPKKNEPIISDSPNKKHTYKDSLDAYNEGLTQKKIYLEKIKNLPFYNEGRLVEFKDWDTEDRYKSDPNLKDKVAPIKLGVMAAKLRTSDKTFYEKPDGTQVEVSKKEHEELTRGYPVYKKPTPPIPNPKSKEQIKGSDGTWYDIDSFTPDYAQVRYGNTTAVRPSSDRLRSVPLTNFEEGGEYDLTEEEIAEILANGGEIEYL